MQVVPEETWKDALRVRLATALDRVTDHETLCILSRHCDSCLLFISKLSFLRSLVRPFLSGKTYQHLYRPPNRYLSSTMSNTKTIPNPKSKAADSKLIEDLITLSERKGKKALVKSSTYDAPGDPEIKVRSWKMDEYKYYDVPSPFPSLVRGLFTVDLPGNKNKEYRIVCRGYDKFFNIGEVPWTTVRKS